MSIIWSWSWSWFWVFVLLNSDYWRDCKLCSIYLCPSSFSHTPWCTEHYCQVSPYLSRFLYYLCKIKSANLVDLTIFSWFWQCCFSPLLIEGEATENGCCRVFILYCRISYNSYPCTSGTYSWFCWRDLGFSNSTR